MSNMSYCRFENTLDDLIDCSHHIEVCREIVDEADFNQDDEDEKKSEG